MNNKTKTVMVVDDDPKIVKALALRLSAAGYQTITTFNGMTGLILAKVKRPDLIITDIWMPSGCGLSMAFRMNQLFPGTPLIFLTASKQPGLKEKAMELGAAGYMEKPYEPGVLLQLVAELLAAGEQVVQQEELKLVELVAH